MMQARVISGNNAARSSPVIFDPINSVLPLPSLPLKALDLFSVLSPSSHCSFTPSPPFYPQIFHFKHHLLPSFASFQPFQFIQRRFRPSFLEIEQNIKEMRPKRGQKPLKDKSKGGVGCGGVGGQSVETIKAKETLENSRIKKIKKKIKLN